MKYFKQDISVGRLSLGLPFVFDPVSVTDFSLHTLCVCYGILKKIKKIHNQIK